MHDTSPRIILQSILGPKSLGLTLRWEIPFDSYLSNNLGLILTVLALVVKEGHLSTKSVVGVYSYRVQKTRGKMPNCSI